MRCVKRRRSFVSAGGVLIAYAGVAASAHAALFTFNPTCAPFQWTSQCGGAACGGGQFTQTNNFGFSSCGGTPLLPGAGDDVIFAGNGTINVGTAVATITINPGVVVTQAANIATTAVYQNNGTVQTAAGGLLFSGAINNSGTWVEDGGGWTRALNSVNFVNTGALQLPGSVSYNQNAGVNAFSNLTTGSITKSSGGTATFSSFNFVNNASVVASAGGGSLNFTNMAFVSQASATYAASAGGAINFSGGSIRGPFPMTLTGPNLVSFANVSLTGPTTLSATGGAALLGGNITGSATNTLTNTGLVNVAGGSVAWAGGFTNTSGATWTEDSAGWTRALNSHSFSNAGTLNFPGSVNWSQNSGTNTFSNTGTVVKSSGGTMQMTGYARTNSGAMVVQPGGGTLQFNGSSFASTGGATYTVAGPSSAMFWNSNTISGNFPIALSAGGAASFTSPTTSAPTTIASTGGATVINAGSMTTTSGLLTNTGQLAFGPGNHTWSGPWTNTVSGVITEDGAGWTKAFNSVAVTNAGTINFPGGVIWAQNAGVNSVVNSGTMNKTSGGQFHSNGLGTFTNNGAIAIASGGGNFLVDGATFSGSGTISVGGAGAAMQLNNCIVSSGITGSNAGGTVQSTGTMTVPASTTTVLNISGSGFTVNSNLAINTTSGLLRNVAVANVTGGNKNFSGDITNAAGATWTEEGSGWTRTLNSHDFINQGTLNLPGSVIWAQNAGVNTMLNTGTINKTSAGSFTVNSIASVTNNGTIAIASGGGTFSVDSSAYSGSGTVTIGTGGNMQLVNSTVTGPINGVNTGGTFQSIGTLTTGAGGASLNVPGAGFTINSNRAGSTLLTNTGNVAVTGGDKTFTGPITNAAGATWTEEGSGWTRAMNSSVFTNNGTLNFPGSVTWNLNSGSNSLTNAATGVVNKTAGGVTSVGFSTVNAGLIDIASGTYNANGGLVQTASTGRVLVRSGAALGGATWNMANGRLEGRGIVSQVYVNGGGTVAPGESASVNGVLSFGNTFTQSSGGTYEVSLFGRPSSAHDRIVSANQMNLGGTLRVVITPPFLPKLGDVYEIARSNSNQRVGTFSSVVVDGPAAVTVSVSYTASTALLTITGTECGSIDFNNDLSFFDPQDIEAFLSIYGEGPCVPVTATCNDIDFNNDTSVFDPCDISSFLTVYGEGPCTPCGG